MYRQSDREYIEIHTVISQEGTLYVPVYATVQYTYTSVAGFQNNMAMFILSVDIWRKTDKRTEVFRIRYIQIKRQRVY